MSITPAIPCRDRDEAFALAKELRSHGFQAAVAADRAAGPGKVAVEVGADTPRLVIRAALAQVRGAAEGAGK